MVTMLLTVHGFHSFSITDDEELIDPDHELRKNPLRPPVKSKLREKLKWIVLITGAKHL